MVSGEFLNKRITTMAMQGRTCVSMGFVAEIAFLFGKCFTVTGVTTVSNQCRRLASFAVTGENISVQEISCTQSHIFKYTEQTI